MPKSALPPHLQDRKHEDYVFPLSLIPRAWTAFKFGGPPSLLAGNQTNFHYAPLYMDGQGSSAGVQTPDPIPDPLLNDGRFTWGLYGVSLFCCCPRLPLGFAFSFKCGTRRVHFRVGARWDSVDFYYQFPSFEVSFKKKY